MAQAPNPASWGPYPQTARPNNRAAWFVLGLVVTVGLLLACSTGVGLGLPALSHAISAAATARAERPGATPPANTGPPAPAGTTLIYGEDFRHPEHQWRTGLRHDSNLEITDGMLQVTSLLPNEAIYVPLNTSLGDGVISLDAELVHGTSAGAFGVQWRAAGADSYFLAVFADGKWTYGKHDRSGFHGVQGPVAASALHAGSGRLNHVEIDLNGDRFTFKMNGVTVGGATDGTYGEAGDVYFFCGSRQTVGLRDIYVYAKRS